MRKEISLVCAALVLSSCSSIQHTQVMEQPAGKQLAAGPGDLVVRISKQRDLKNAFGNADLFGRKTDEGYSELRFAGVEADGTVVFYRKDIDITTNETTMSRSGISQSYGSARTSATRTGPSSVTATTTGIVTTIGPVSDYHVVVPPETIAIRIPPGTRSFPFEGRSVELLSSDRVSLTYRVSQ